MFMPTILKKMSLIMSNECSLAESIFIKAKMLRFYISFFLFLISSLAPYLFLYLSQVLPREAAKNFDILSFLSSCSLSK